MHDNRRTDGRGHCKTVDHHLHARLPDGLEYAGDVHTVEGGVEGEFLGVAGKQGCVVDKMGALVHHLDKVRERGKLIQRRRKRLFHQAVG